MAKGVTAVTVSVAAFELTEPALLVATQRYWLPLNVASALVMLSAAVVTPERYVPLAMFNHVPPPLEETCH